jgi:hypothetical protein
MAKMTCSRLVIVNYINLNLTNMPTLNPHPTIDTPTAIWMIVFVVIAVLCYAAPMYRK